MKVIGNPHVIALSLLALLPACERQHADQPPATAAKTSESTPAVTVATENGQDIPDPPEIRSQNGQLSMVLEAKPAKITVAGKTFTSNVYHGMYVPPVIVVQRGDNVSIKYVNNIDKSDVGIDGPQPSNLHTHGMAISPNQPADNAYIGIPSGVPTSKQSRHEHGYEKLQSFPDGSGLSQTAPNIFEYRWKVPIKHPRGLHWYHPHAHGMVEDQVLNGMSGLLIVDGFIQMQYPELNDLTVRRFLLKDMDLPGAKDGEPKTKTINGIAGGVIRMRPGEMQVWEIGNVGADAFFDLAVDQHPLNALSFDGNVLSAPQRHDNLFLVPGARSAVVILAGAPGEHPIRSRAVDTGPAGDPNPDVVLAKLIVAGEPVDSSVALARLQQPAENLGDVSPTIEELEVMPVIRKRTITFSETADGKTFFINGKEFDSSRDDITVTLGDVEEWTLLNTSGEKHVFHIHQLDFLVESINDNDPDAEGLRDVVDIPNAIKGRPGKVVLKLPFTDPLMVGRFPFHCHILEHEDAGMMATLRVKPAPFKSSH